MEVMLLEDELSASQSCGQRFKVCSIHIKRPVLATMHVQTSSLLGTGPLKILGRNGTTSQSFEFADDNIRTEGQLLAYRSKTYL